MVGSKLFPVKMALNTAVEGTAPSSLLDVFSNLFTNLVNNPLVSISSANYIGILFWALLLGIALKMKAKPVTIDVIADFAEIVSQTVRWIVKFAPFGIMGLVFTSVSESGLEVFTTYGQLVLLLVGCMLFGTLVFNPLIAFLMTHKNPYPLLFTCLRESGINAFFTRSSAANIPINMRLCQKLGLDEKFYSVCIPLGATINMDGAAVTITVMTLAVANTMGVEVSFFSALFLRPLCGGSAAGAGCRFICGLRSVLVVQQKIHVIRFKLPIVGSSLLFCALRRVPGSLLHGLLSVP